MKYLIAGLGNIGDEYAQTRHNIGFTVLDALAKASNTSFKDNRYGSISEVKYKGRVLLLLKPSTFMNLSGNAINYWMQKEKIELENLLVVVDDIALDYGTIRLRPAGSDGGHNGLKHIQEILGHNNYNRLRFGIGSNFGKGRQVEYVLGKWTEEELKLLPPYVDKACEAIKSFSTMGMQRSMNTHNTK